MQVGCLRPGSPKNVMEDLGRKEDNLFPEARPPTEKQLMKSTPQQGKGRNKRQRIACSLLQPQVPYERHPFMRTLHKWATHGCPVDCGRPWPIEVTEQAVLRGPHPSAMTAESLELFEEDIAYQVKAGFCEIMPWEQLKRLRPNSLKISPVAVVPQRNRRGRIILDLSFPVYPTGSKRHRSEPLQQSVNDSTAKQAPREPVEELGNVIWRILDIMDKCEEDDLQFQKIDLSDGFWRMIVAEEEKWNFCYVLPSALGSEIRIVVPSALQMGWTESPGYFAAATETIRDVIAGDLEIQRDFAPHKDEHFTIPATPPKPSAGPDEFVGNFVYVDDFINVATESAQGGNLLAISRASLHAIHEVFPPPAVTGHEGGKDPISLKKLQKGDARWSPTKEILGFLFDGHGKTVQLPEDKSAEILVEIKRILKKKTVPFKRFQILLGKLRHVAIILPGLRGLFTPGNRVLGEQPSRVPLHAKSPMRQMLKDMASLVQQLQQRPTHARELVPLPPNGPSNGGSRGGHAANA
jgi:hypothetical protein